MTILGRFSLAILLASLSFGQDEPVRARLASSVAAIEPGGRAWVAVELRIAPGFHIYWRDPGDSGIATEVRFTPVDGLVFGPLQWPAPEVHAIPDIGRAFVYEDEVLLLAEIRATPDAAAGPRRLEARIDWLVCDESCAAGGATVVTSIEVAAGRRESPDAARLALWVDRTPVEPGPKTGVAATQRTESRDGSGPVWIVELVFAAPFSPLPEPLLVPSVPAGVSVVSTKIEWLDPGRLRVETRLGSRGPAPDFGTAPPELVIRFRPTASASAAPDRHRPIALRWAAGTPVHPAGSGRGIPFESP